MLTIFHDNILIPLHKTDSKKIRHCFKQGKNASKTEDKSKTKSEFAVAESDQLTPSALPRKAAHHVRQI